MIGRPHFIADRCDQSTIEVRLNEWKIENFKFRSNSPGAINKKKISSNPKDKYYYAICQIAGR